MNSTPIVLLLVIISIASFGCVVKEEKSVHVPAVAVRVEHPPAATSLSQQLKQDEYLVSLRVTHYASIKVGSHVDVLSVFKDPKSGQATCLTLLQDVVVAAMNQNPAVPEVSLRLDSEALVRKAALADGAGVIGLLLREENDGHVEKELAKTTRETLLEQTRMLALQKTSGSGASGKMRSMTLPMVGAWMAKGGDDVSVLCTLAKSASGEAVVFPLGQNIQVVETYPGYASLALLPREAELLFFASQVGTLHLVHDGQVERGKPFSMEKTKLDSFLESKRLKKLPRGPRDIQIVE